MQVSVERYIEQVSDGKQYKGNVKIAETTLDYNLTFMVPIPRLHEWKPESKDEIRRTFAIAVRGKRDIKLTDEEYSFFFSLLVPFAVDFYNDPQTRSHNEGTTGILNNVAKVSLTTLGGTMSIGVKSRGLCDLPTEVCGMLAAQ